MYELCDYKVSGHVSEEHNHKYRVSKTKSRTLILGVVKQGFPIKFQAWPCIIHDNVVSWLLKGANKENSLSCSLTPKIILRQI